MGRKVEENEVSALVYHFSQVPDPRVVGRCEHLLIDVLVVTICAVLCGAQTCTDFEDYGRSKESWLRKYLKLKGGVPSHDTFRRVLSIIDPLQLEQCFLEWVEFILGERKTRRVSLDGKSIGGSPSGGPGGRKALHVVNAYSHEYSLCLGQTESDGIGGETNAAMELLDKLDIKDTLVLADAGFSIHRIVNKIREKKGHYLVNLKDNNRFYRERVAEAFEKNSKIMKSQTKERGHGREEIRTAQVLAADSKLDEKFFTQWPDLTTLIRVERSRTFEDKRPMLQKKNEKTGEISFVRNAGLSEVKIMRTEQDTAYYLTSKKLTAEQALNEVRKHWGIENGLHWVLDVAFGEDDWLGRAKRLSRNLAAIRRIGLNLIRSNKTLAKKSIRRHMKIAGWSDEALEKLVFQTNFGA